MGASSIGPTTDGDVPIGSAGDIAGKIADDSTIDLPPDIAPEQPLFDIAPCDSRSVADLRAALKLEPLVAQTLVRRGYIDSASAKEYLDVGELLDAELLPGAIDAAGKIAEHVRAGSRIAVHGDYDVDGVCSTAILVRTLDRLKAQVTWHVPSRFTDGYGLSSKAIDRLADQGVELIVAVDCGVTAVDEVAHARALGVDVVICDHHTPGDALPEAPIAHPALGDYDCPQLCAAAVTYKVCQVLVSRLDGDPAMLDDELELAALATVCDVVPLVKENRAIVQRGLAAMRTTRRAGLRELMRVAGVDQLSIDAGAFGFRLGPRINAVGRMFSAEPAVELMLTTSESRAEELAEELSIANARRKDIEQTILFEAETQARRQRDRFAIVVSGEGWHAGVLGIVAGRIAERFRRPCVALGIEDGVAAGSGRAGGVYDLLSGLDACSDHLVRYGGHRAAAGLQLDATALTTFTREFQEHAANTLTVDDLRPRVRVDAVAEPAQLTLTAAEALERLGPFGAGNAEPSVLLPAVTVTQLKRMGEGGRHLRLGIAGHGGRAGAVAFGWDRAVAFGEQAPLSNMVVKLRRNEFRGVVEGQSRLVAHVDLGQADEPLAATETLSSEDAWMSSFQSAFVRPLPTIGDDAIEIERVIDRRGDSALAALIELAVESADCVLLVNDPSRWSDRLRALKSVDDRIDALRVMAYDELPGEMDIRPHLVLGEPPLLPSHPLLGRERVTVAWSAAAASASAADLHTSALNREHVVAAYRAIKNASDTSIKAIATLLSDALPSPETAALAVRVLNELRLVGVQQCGDSVEAITATDDTRTSLDRSAIFRSYSELKDQTQRWLVQPTRTKAILAA